MGFTLKGWRLKDLQGQLTPRLGVPALFLRWGRVEGLGWRVPLKGSTIGLLKASFKGIFRVKGLGVIRGSRFRA